MQRFANPVVLHIAADYPGPFSPAHVTVAIESLVERTRGRLDNLVVIPRRSRIGLLTRRHDDASRLHLRMFSPFGSLIPAGPVRLGRYRSEILSWLGNRRPDVIHSHKLSYEAGIGEHLANFLGVPHVVSVRGSSDTNRRNFQFSGGGRYKRILRTTAANLWVSAWAQPVLKHLTGYVTTEKDTLFPNAIDASGAPERTSHWTPDALVCVGRMDDYEQKGVLSLIRGLAALRSEFPQATLDLIGPMQQTARDAIEAEVHGSRLDGRVRVLGPRAKAEIPQLVSGYAAMAMLASAETFGLVYVEALLSGTPVVYLADSGIDGYPFARHAGIRCESRDIGDVVKALRRALADQSALRAALDAQLSTDEFACLSPEVQDATYVDLISALRETH